MKRRTFFTQLACAGSLCFALHSAAGQTTTTSNSLAIGQRAPEFKLKDQTGQERALSDLLKKGKVALVFYRSADW